MRFRRLKRALTLLVACGLYVWAAGWLYMAPLGVHNVVLATGFLAVSILTFRFGRQFRPDSARRRVPSGLLLGVALLIGGGTLFYANHPVRSDFTSEVCGSAAAPRRFGNNELTFARYMCEEDVTDLQGQVLALGLVAMTLLALWARRPHDFNHPRLMAMPVTLGLLGVGALPALTTRHEVAAVSVPPLRAAQPALVTICNAVSNWGIEIGESLRPIAGHKPATLEERREYTTRIVGTTATATRHVVDALKRAKAQYGDVAGLPAFTDIMLRAYEPMVAPLEQLTADAQALPLTSKAAYDKKLKGISAQFKRLSAHMETSAARMIPNDRDAARVAATMDVTPECAFVR